MITLFSLLLAAQPLEAELGFSASVSKPALALSGRARRWVSSGLEIDREPLKTLGNPPPVQELQN
jgi:hypothetical protein